VAYILPFNPNLGDQMLSSISSDFVTSMLHVELLLLPSLGLPGGENTKTIRKELCRHYYLQRKVGCGNLHTL
jgi:hypothetical protein